MARQFTVSGPLGGDVLLFHRMTAREVLGRPFKFELDLLSANGQIQMTDVLGRPMAVHVELPNGGQRHFHGLVSRFAQLGTLGRYHVYQATLRPWLWFLGHSSDCHIFQGRTAPAIIQQVFRDHGFSDFEDALAGAYRTWEYRVQYRETSLQFVSRLMEQEGIYYYFKHEAGKHTLVLCDGHGAHSSVPSYATVPFFPPSDRTPREEHLSRWQVQQEVQPVKYVLEDYNFETPAADLVTTSNTERRHALASGEMYDYPGEYQVFGDGESYAHVRLEELQARHEQASGRGNVRALGAGNLFTLKGALRPDQDREYLIVSATHDMKSSEYESLAAAQSASYECELTAIPSQTQYRPSRRAPRPVVQGVQTAVVVGPAGQEMYHDQYGRVKVQFHWDRHGKNDQESSCWLRVAQIWAGKHWGAFFWPRIGHEVVVAFEEGNPDRPLVVGSVYNAANMPPHPMPEGGTLAGIKSCTVRGTPAHDFNQVLFYDQPNEEYLQLHSERYVAIHNERTRHEFVPAANIQVFGSMGVPTGSGGGGGLFTNDLYPTENGQYTYIFGDNVQLTTTGDALKPSNRLAWIYGTDVRSVASLMSLAELVPILGPLAQLPMGIDGSLAAIVGNNVSLAYGVGTSVTRGPQVKYNTDPLLYTGGEAWETAIMIAVNSLWMLATGLGLAMAVQASGHQNPSSKSTDSGPGNAFSVLGGVQWPSPTPPASGGSSSGGSSSGGSSSGGSSSGGSSSGGKSSGSSSSSSDPYASGRNQLGSSTNYLMVLIWGLTTFLEQSVARLSPGKRLTQEAAMLLAQGALNPQAMAPMITSATENATKSALLLVSALQSPSEWLSSSKTTRPPANVDSYNSDHSFVAPSILVLATGTQTSPPGNIVIDAQGQANNGNVLVNGSQQVMLASGPTRLVQKQDGSILIDSGLTGQKIELHCGALGPAGMTIEMTPTLITIQAGPASSIQLTPTMIYMKSAVSQMWLSASGIALQAGAHQAFLTPAAGWVVN